MIQTTERQTLDRQIPVKGMPINRLLEIGVQMADAMTAAHAAGIIHRDLKPSNVMLSERGQVKILDFGLAKVVDRGMPGPDAHPEAGGLESSMCTKDGMILGTTTYTSPEQAQGKPLDARSDISSFGAILYEMVSGQRAFLGDGTAAVLASIIRDEPKPLADPVPGIPAARRITNQGLLMGGTAWSRDGRSLVYGACVNADSDSRLWHVGIDGRQEPEMLEIAGFQASTPTIAPVNSSRLR